MSKLNLTRFRQNQSDDAKKIQMFFNKEMKKKNICLINIAGKLKKKIKYKGFWDIRDSRKKNKKRCK